MSTVTELWVYPVKGLAGISVQQAELTPTGLQYDRHWMVVDESGRFMTQRQLPQMATIKTELTATELVLSHPSQPEPLRLPLQPTSATLTEVKVWQSKLPAALLAGAGQWLTDTLQSRKTLQLVRFAEQQIREVSGTHLHCGERSHTHFADGFPLLLCNQETLTQLNDALIAKQQQPVPMTRFRGNIIVDQCGGSMQELNDMQLGGEQVQIATRKPCERCPVTRVDQLTGERPHAKEPLPTLVEINPLTNQPGAFFGGNAIVLQTGTIRVGETLVCS
ncbi:MOSC domain-containing protein [Ferrimonas lipolytica]|uniref:MOSC domain-containing protein n=1 Tax=Ferrimonas lipolytica TaxID=2724191 RepID=A0A6H1UI20_9GAMM|nr:MOSC N-terminal beta barrel domain-containing protein [Ferrimonas lipolytica]QIZ78731.1 MOSC domain-containing protein [Ferrimonas lipolytica]